MATRSTGARQQRDGPGPGRACSPSGLSDRHVPRYRQPRCAGSFFRPSGSSNLIPAGPRTLFQHDHGVAWIAGGLVITAAFCVNLPAGPDVQRHAGRGWRCTGSGPSSRWPRWPAVVYGKNWVPLWIYVSRRRAGMVLTSVYDRRRASPRRPSPFAALPTLLFLLDHPLRRRAQHPGHNCWPVPAHRPGHDRVPAADDPCLRQLAQASRDGRPSWAANEETAPAGPGPCTT